MEDHLGMKGRPFCMLYYHSEFKGDVITEMCFMVADWI